MEILLGLSLGLNISFAVWFYFNFKKPQAAVAIPKEVIEETIYGVTNEITSHLSKGKRRDLSLVDFEEPLDEDELAYFQKQQGAR